MNASAGTSSAIQTPVLHPAALEPPARPAGIHNGHKFLFLSARSRQKIRRDFERGRWPPISNSLSIVIKGERASLLR